MYLMIRETQSRGPAREMLEAIPNDLYKYHDAELYEVVAELIGSRLETEYVVIGAIEEGKTEVNARVFWSKGHFVEGVRYPLRSGPCGSVIKNRELTQFGPEVRLLFPDEKRLFEWNINAYIGVPLFNSNEKVIGVLAAMSEKKLPRDPIVELILRMYSGRISAEMERSMGEQALRESEERFRQLFDNMPLAMGIRDTNEELLVDVNPRMEELFGMSREALIGRHRGADTTMEDDQLRKKLTEQLIKGEISRFSTDKRYRTQYGNEILCRTTRSLVYIKGHKYVIGILEDITHEKKIEAQLREKIRELDEKNRKLSEYIDSNLQLENFAYFASHDLKEPLRTIGSFAQLLNRRYRNQLDQSALEYLDFIVGGVQNMNRLINDLLVYARVSRIQLEKEAVNPRILIREIKQRLNQVIHDSNVTIEIGDMPEWIYGYHTNLQQLFQNLITNAIKFRSRERPAWVRIEGKSKEGMWEFAVHDNGIGMEAQFHEQIFNMFRKLHSRTEFEGTGIGLALCKKVVEQHQGSISVDSIPGEGTTFRFTLEIPADYELLPAEAFSR